MLTRFIQMSFKERPKADGEYICFHKPDKTYTLFNYTVEYGWNTHRNLIDGSISHADAMTDETMAVNHGHWLKPYNIGSCNWFDQITEMMEEIKDDLRHYEDRKLDDDEMWVCSNLEDMYELLERARDYAGAFR